MGSHQDAVSIAAELHATEFGSTAVYTPPSGVSRTISIVAYPVRTERRSSSAGQIEVQVRDAMVAVADLPSPVILGTLQISGESWTIESMQQTPSARWKLSLTKTAAIEMNRANYRRGSTGR